MYRNLGEGYGLQQAPEIGVEKAVLPRSQGAGMFSLHLCYIIMFKEKFFWLEGDSFEQQQTCKNRKFAKENVDSAYPGTLKRRECPVGTKGLHSWCPWSRQMQSTALNQCY